MKKQVLVLFPVVIEVDKKSTLDSIWDEAAEVLMSNSIHPIIQDANAMFEIETDDDLKQYLKRRG
jgi:hypothetical protein